jgi:hypothetical protein
MIEPSLMFLFGVVLGLVYGLAVGILITNYLIDMHRGEEAENRMWEVGK